MPSQGLAPFFLWGLAFTLRRLQLQDKPRAVPLALASFLWVEMWRRHQSRCPNLKGLLGTSDACARLPVCPFPVCSRISVLVPPQADRLLLRPLAKTFLKTGTIPFVTMFLHKIQMTVVLQTIIEVHYFSKGLSIAIQCRAPWVLGCCWPCGKDHLPGQLELPGS